MNERPGGLESFKPYGLEYIAQCGHSFCTHEGGYVVGPEDVNLHRLMNGVTWFPMEAFTGDKRHFDVMIAKVGERIDIEKLKTRDFQGGVPLELSDGNTWMIPMVRGFNRQIEYRHGVPMRIIKNDRHSYLFARGQKQLTEVLEAIEENGTVMLSVDSDFALDILRCNYRVGEAEVSLAGCLYDKDLLEIVRTFIDLPGVLETLQKKTQELQQSGDGKTAEKDTFQPSGS
jgi:hypothetical protein